MPRIIVGNIVSGLSSIFLFLSSYTDKVGRVYLYQSIECVLLFLSQMIFRQPAASAVMLVALCRNLLIYFGKYNVVFMFSFSLSTLLIGFYFNTGGAIGLLPVISASIYCMSAYFAKGFISVKLVLLVNLVVWIIYSFYIFDLAAVVINVIATVLNISAIAKHRSHNLCSKQTENL